MRSNFLPFSPPLIGAEEIAEVVDTLRSGWITSGPKTKQFELDFATYFGSPGTLAVNSCTAAMHLALSALGIGPGDEVITTGWTFAATANVIEHVGATPVLVDIEPDTLNISPQAIAEAISPRTRAILPVHFAGHPVELDSIYELASPRGVAVVEDAAHGIGASYRGRNIGSSENPVAFSFYATKNLATGEGGMLTGSPDFLEKARVASLHGMSREAWGRYTQGGNWVYDVVTPGFKYNMTDVQASLGIWQLKKFARMQARRREIVATYQSAFARYEELELPAVRQDIMHAWHLYVLRIHENKLNACRNAFIEEMKNQNIGVSVHFIPIQKHSYYREKYGLQLKHYPVTAANAKRTISLPLSPAMRDEDVADVIAAVSKVVEKYRIKKAVA